MGRRQPTLSRRQAKLRAQVEQLDALLARLPAIECKGLCSVACGVLPLTLLEANCMKTADPRHRDPAITADGDCIYLTAKKRCGVYDVRPLICRAWGVLKTLSCMHGCVPERWLPETEFLEIAQAIERLGRPLLVTGVEGPMRHDKSFLNMTDARQITDDEQRHLDAHAERVRGLRALHGGRILLAAPGATSLLDPGVTQLTHIDKARDD